MVEVKKKALIVSTIIGFLIAFEINDIRKLQGLGYEVHCACNCDRYIDEEKKRTFMDTGIIEHHIPFTRRPFSRINIKAYQELKNLMKLEHFDLIHCHTPVGGVLGRMAAKVVGVPIVIYTAHGFHFFKGCPPKNRLLFYPVEKYMSRFTDILITINNEDYEIAKNRFYAKRIERIHGVGIDIEKFSNPNEGSSNKRVELGVKDNEILLLSVGELDRDKNHIEVLKAMKSLAPKGYKYVIAGNGGLKKSYQHFIDMNNLSEHIQLLGYRSDIPELLQAADIYVFPSLFEGLSVALMEAVAAKIPIVCSKVRGNVDTVITPESYFNARDTNTLIKAIERVQNMTNDEKKMMTENNYHNLLKYRLSEVQMEMTNIYKYADEAIEKVRKQL